MEPFARVKRQAVRFVPLCSRVEEEQCRQHQREHTRPPPVSRPAGLLLLLVAGLGSSACLATRSALNCPITVRHNTWDMRRVNAVRDVNTNFWTELKRCLTRLSNAQTFLTTSMGAEPLLRRQ